MRSLLSLLIVVALVELLPLSQSKSVGLRGVDNFDGIESVWEEDATFWERELKKSSKKGAEGGKKNKKDKKDKKDGKKDKKDGKKDKKDGKKTRRRLEVSTADADSWTTEIDLDEDFQFWERELKKSSKKGAEGGKKDKKDKKNKKDKKDKKGKR